jgi:hypothetical protein
MIPNPNLIKFIKEARRRGFDDYNIRVPLLKQGWKVEDVECAFASLRKINRAHYQFKNKVTIYLDNDLLKMIDKRAKKNMLTLPEQIEDTLRRSCLNLKKKPTISGKIDDLLVSIFSRQQRKKK